MRSTRAFDAHAHSGPSYLPLRHGAGSPVLPATGSRVRPAAGVLSERGDRGRRERGDCAAFLRVT
jgi:hypothetical protein